MIADLGSEVEEKGSEELLIASMGGVLGIIECKRMTGLVERAFKKSEIGIATAYIN